MCDEQAIIEHGWQVFNAMRDKAAIIGGAMPYEFKRHELEIMPQAEQARFFHGYVAQVEMMLCTPTFDEASFMMAADLERASAISKGEVHPNRYERRKAKALARKAAQ